MLILQVLIQRPNWFLWESVNEHNLQNQIHFTEIQDKACNDFSQSIVVLQLIFLMCHSHSYWQLKLHQLFQAAGQSSVQCILVFESLYPECPAFMPCGPCLHSSVIKLISQLNLPSSCFKGQLQRTNFIWLVSWLCSSMNQPPCFVQKKEILIFTSED